MKNIFTLMLFIVLIVSTALAQNRSVSGTIKDNQNRPVVNASILVKGTNLGTASDAGGNFEISVPEESNTLIFSAVGYADQEIEINERKHLNVIMADADQNIDEVVVMGYSTIDRKHVASSVSQLDVTEVKSRPIMKMEQAFSGTIPGVTMMQGNSMPGDVPGNIAIRGVSTLQNAGPLVIVDGIEQGLTDVDPNQIKSLTVLKDAASTAMYGSRGANGVIVIETERGTTGQFKVDLNAW
ncbi:MAG: carboxypeptidase-like regulatory domain-containing protein, partial [Sphingobacterium sp.]